ncbi:MAG TPA: hypothetical protein PK095_03980 [Myxococcota bacterium]|nr:hypothetical protein [Myxococcota bacterium]
MSEHDLQVGGPVSRALENELRSMVQKKGVVIWLDQASHYVGFVDRLIAARQRATLPYEVFAFRGSHLRLMMALDGVAAGLDRPPLLVHMPGHTEDTIREAPLFELYSAGTRFRKGLDTLLGEAAGGKVKPELIAAVSAQRDLTLEGADAWLEARLAELGALGVGGLSAELAAMSPNRVLDALLRAEGSIADAVTSGHELALWDRFSAWLGPDRLASGDVARSEAPPRGRRLFGRELGSRCRVCG